MARERERERVRRGSGGREDKRERREEIEIETPREDKPTPPTEQKAHTSSALHYLQKRAHTHPNLGQGDQPASLLTSNRRKGKPTTTCLPRHAASPATAATQQKAREGQQQPVYPSTHPAPARIPLLQT